jgi:Methylamine utilisation protein MauE
MTGDVVTISGLDLVRHLSYAVELSLGIVFLLAAITKVRHPSAFVRTVARYRLVPGRMTRATAFLLIATEAFLAFAFLTGWTTEIALPLAAAVLVVFSIAAAVNLRRGRRIPCGCFGGETEHISARSLVRLAMLMAAVLALEVVPATPITVGKLAHEGASALAYLVQAGALAVFLVLAAAWVLSLREVAFVLRGLQRVRDQVAAVPVGRAA